MVRPKCGLIQHDGLAFNDGLHGRIAEPVGIEVHPVGPPAARYPCGDVAPGDGLEFCKVACGRGFVARKISCVASCIHFAEEEFPAQGAGVGYAFGFEDAAHAAALIVMRGDQPVHTWRIQ